jgi:squalene-hopene/tetraprenyl-beta-curcumene cyclase
LRLGGIPHMNTYGKLYLALLGQFPWKDLPTIPAEIFLFPKWFPFGIHEMSSWTRAILAPLAILNHLRPTRPLPDDVAIHELFPAGLEGTDLSLKTGGRFWSWSNFFLRCDRLLKWHEASTWKPLRRRALAVTEEWMVERMGSGSEGLAAIYPAMLNSLIALEALGYDRGHAVLRKARADFQGLFVEDDGDFRIQPCLSPVWDTAITVQALAESGLAGDHPALVRAADWLEDREVRFAGDWTVKNPGVEPSGWAFEHANKFYPDTDDTMMVLMALRLIRPPDCQRHRAVQERALRWLLSFQCRDGGWAAFDKDVTKHWLEDVPFADHNAILDPTCSDLTARVLELLGKLGWNTSEPRVRRALAMLKATQEEDGSWYGRWGVNYLYGTWQVLRGLASIGVSMDEPWVRRAANWIESCQNEDGGWGESPASYEDPALKGKGPSTASQTAWALMGLAAASPALTDSMQRGIDWLVRTQNPDGSWTELETTGTGFPKVFYLRYDSYRLHFPLLALAACAKLSPAAPAGSCAGGCSV